MSYDYRDGNDDDNNDREKDFGNGNDDNVDNRDQYPVDDDYDKSGTGKMDSPGNSDKKDFDDDFFKDEDFEFADYSGDDVEEEGYRSKRIRERRKRRKLIYTSLTVFMIIVIIAAAIVFGYRYIKNRFFAPVEIAEEDRITVPESLELGQDINIIMATAGEDLLEPDISSIVFTSYYSTSGETRSLVMPTKTLMDVPGIGAELIGRSVEIGGMDLLSLTLEKGLGMDMEIDHYMLMDIKSIVGKLGGIELSLDQAYAVKNYADGTTFSLEPGVNLLDGSETQNMLKYFSGIERDIPIEDIKMQKKIIDTIMARIVGEGEEDLTNNINLVKDYIDSDLSLEELLKLFSTFSKIETSKNMVYTLMVSSTELEGEGIVYLPDVANLSNLFNKDQVQEEVVIGAERTITVTILNGVGTPGIAAELSDALKAQVYESGKVKFDILEVGNADNFNYSESEIVVYSSNESIIMTAASEIKGMLGTGNITTREEEVVSSDIVIILGSDYDPTAAQDVVPVEVIGIVDMVILNGEGTAKLAATVQGILEDHFNKDEKIIEVKETRDADNWNYTQTEIIIYADDEGIEAFAQQIQERMGAGVIKKSDNNVDNVDITVIVGSDYTSQ
ncbi:MAG: LytR C-terminal domain-containing protein [Candidatus Humimicrobiaceae bacterium]